MHLVLRISQAIVTFWIKDIAQYFHLNVSEVILICTNFKLSKIGPLFCAKLNTLNSKSVCSKLCLFTLFAADSSLIPTTLLFLPYFNWGTSLPLCLLSFIEIVIHNLILFSLFKLNPVSVPKCLMALEVMNPCSMGGGREEREKYIYGLVCACSYNSVRLC